MTAIKQYIPRAVNIVPDPTFESGVINAQQSNNPTLFTPGYDTTIKHSGARSFMTTRLAATPNTQLGAAILSPAGAGGAAIPLRIVVTPGETLSIGFWHRVGGTFADTLYRAGVTVQFRDATTTALVGTAYAPAVAAASNPPGQWNLYTSEGFTVTAPAGAVFATPIAVCYTKQTGVNSVGGEICYWDSLIIVKGPKIEPYFDGNTPGCSWEGTPHQSRSIRAVVTPWTQWDGTKENPLDISGQWDGAALQPVDLRDVTIV